MGGVDRKSQLAKGGSCLFLAALIILLNLFEFNNNNAF